jgi:hypothetical protein
VDLQELLGIVSVGADQGQWREEVLTELPEARPRLSGLSLQRRQVDEHRAAPMDGDIERAGIRERRTEVEGFFLNGERRPGGGFSCEKLHS